MPHTTAAVPSWPVRGNGVRLMAIVLTFLVVGMTQGGVARAERSAIFGATCSDTHRLKDDPIVFPGQAGRSHLHEFTGSWSTNASSTLDSMRRSGMSCSVKGDTAGYWTPTMHDASGKLIKKGFSTAYYVGNHKDRTKIVPFPAGLKVIADMDNPAAIAANAGWHCGNARVPGGGPPDPVKIPDCNGLDDGPGGMFPDDTHVEAKIVFPDCWDGRNLDSADHRSHMAYVGSKGACPTTHPVSVPRLHLKSVYDTYGGPGITLSSGAPGTMHADFWNTWDQTQLAFMIRSCINLSGTEAVCASDSNRRLENPNYPLPTAPGAAPFSWPPSDTAKPAVALPDLYLSTKTFSATTTLNATATDNVGVLRVEFLVDGQEQFIDNTRPYSFSWDTRSVSDGCHTVQARAVDVVGKTAVTRVFSLGVRNRAPSLLVDTAKPTVCFSNPAPDAVVKGTTALLSAAAGDDVAVAGVRFLLDGASLGSEDTSSPYKASWNMRTSANGPHNLTAIARDGAGNTETTTMTLILNNGSASPPDVTKPALSITAPDSGSTVSGLLRATARAVDPPATADGFNVSRVEFWVDGALKVTDTTSPYNGTIDTRSLSNGSHTVTAKAYDTATTPNVSTVTVGVRASNGGEPPPAGDTIAPSVPAGVTALAANSTSVNVAWGPSVDIGIGASGVAGYNVLRNGVVIASPTGLTYTDTGRTANTSYSYSVQAFDVAANKSASSAAVSVTTPAGTPSVPPPGVDTIRPTTSTNLTATAVSPNRIDLAWNASTDAGGSGMRGYRVYRNGVFMTLTSATTYSDSTLLPGTSYKFGIEAVDNAGNKASPMATVIKVTPPA